MHGCEAPEWDYSGLCDSEAFLSFQAAAVYCLTCSGTVYAGITTECSPRASQGGRDCAVARSLLDAL